MTKPNYTYSLIDILNKIGMFMPLKLTCIEAYKMSPNKRYQHKRGKKAPQVSEYIENI